MKTIIGQNSYANDLACCGWEVINVSPGQCIVTNGEKNHALPGPTKKGWRPVWDQFVRKVKIEVFREPVLRKFTEDDYRSYPGADCFGNIDEIVEKKYFPLIINWRENGIEYDIVLSREMTGIFIYSTKCDKNYSLDYFPADQEEAYKIARAFMYTLSHYGTTEFKRIYPMVRQ